MKRSYLLPHGHFPFRSLPPFPPPRGWLQFGTAFALLAAATLMMTGCGKRPLAVHDSDAFQASAPELKRQWQIAFAAAKTNGYLVAYSNLQNLRSQPNLTAPQATAVEELIGVVGTRMFNAANNGDPEATKALKEVQATAKRR